jgi:hypothetical protein
MDDDVFCQACGKWLSFPWSGRWFAGRCRHRYRKFLNHMYCAGCGDGWLGVDGDKCPVCTSDNTYGFGLLLRCEWEDGLGATPLGSDELA